MAKRLSGPERRESIVGAAISVFAELGYQRTTMAEVARRVGVSEPVVFQNFGSKAAVFAAVLEAAGDRLSAAMRDDASAHPSIGSWLAELLSPKHQAHLHRRGELGALFADAATLPDEPDIKRAARAAHRTVAATLAELMAQGQSDGSLRGDVDAEAGAWWVVSLLASHGLRRVAVSDHARVERELGSMTLEVLAARP